MRDSVIVTGATGYFGRYFVEHLAREYQVIAIGRDKHKLDSFFADEIIKVPCDLSEPEECKKVIKELLATYSVSGLVNNAYPLSKNTGFNTPEGALGLHSIDMFTQAFNCGLISPFVLLQEFGNECIRLEKRGAIVNISSMYASVAPDPKLYDGKDTFNPVSYGMAKAALEYMTKYVASFWGKDNIRCNAIAPGSFPNIETQSENSTTDFEFLQRLKDKTTTGEVGHPKELLAVLSLLLGSNNSFINGQVIHVDGGWTVR